MDTSLAMTQEDSCLPSSTTPSHPAEEAKKTAIRALWLAFFAGWLCFLPTILAMIWHFTQAYGQEHGIAISLSSLISFLIMWAIQWNFIRGIRKNKKNSILKLVIFIVIFMLLSSGSDSSEEFAPFMGKAHWLIYISGFGLLMSSFWQLYILWVLQKKLKLYSSHEKRN